MRMKKNSIFWMFAMLMLAVGMSSCNNDDENNDKKDTIQKSRVLLPSPDADIPHLCKI